MYTFMVMIGFCCPAQKGLKLKNYEIQLFIKTNQPFILTMVEQQ